jgi:2-(1,2-epoxy-1,2-dihydrophenyl)acetyl-CoA isomerase
MTNYKDYESLDANIQDNGVLIATLNRPDRLNAFDGPLRRSIRSVIDDAGADDSVRVLVWTGAGRAFCSGADLTAEDRSPVPAAPHDPTFQWCVDLLELPKPTIAAINGPAVGGGLGFALLNDIRFCSTEARLLPIWMKRALHPDDLITWTLPRLAGLGRAMEWLYLAEDIPLDEAEQTGLVNKVLAPDALLPHALAVADKLAALPPMHLALTKQTVLRAQTREPWDAASLESYAQTKAIGSEDFKEGMKAFREKRPPKFVGR